MYLFCNNFVGTSVGNLSKRLKALSFTTCKKPKTNTFQLFLHAKRNPNANRKDFDFWLLQRRSDFTGSHRRWQKNDRIHLPT